MRPGTALAIAIILLSTLALGQSRTDRLPSTKPESIPPASPLPPNGIHDAEERHDHRAQLQVDPEEKEAPPTLKPAGTVVDSLERHVSFAAMLAYHGRYGHLDPSHSATSLLGSALAGGVDVGYGVSSHLALGLSGLYASHSGGDDCGQCSATSWTVGPFVRFHVVQGVRFDPWLSLGTSLASFSLKTPASDTLDYLGADLFDLRVGGDWYAAKNFGFGPLLGLKLTRYFDTPDSASPRNNVALLVALRGIADLPGK